MNIALQIRSIRKIRGLKQKELAEISRMAQPALSRLEDKNYGGYSLVTLARIAKALNCQVKVEFEPLEGNK